jgi:glycosyltransferase involved in cell wall biosynthesis
MRITFFLPHFPAGGQEQVTLALMKGLADRGHHIELLLERREGAYLERVPDTVAVHELRRRSRWNAYPRFLRGWPREGWTHLRGSLGLGQRSIPLHRLGAIVDYMERRRPDTLIAAHDRAPLLALWAAGISRRRVPIVIIEHSLFSQNLAAARGDARTYGLMQHRLALMRRLYPLADKLVAVSNGGAADLANTLNLPREAVETIHNPVVSPTLHERAQEPIDDTWLAEGAPPVILSAARLAPEKALDILIDAFARYRASGGLARLVVLGEGPERERLTRRIAEHHLEEEVRLPGWVDNPYAWMRLSALFVLSSRFESLPTALIEAMACGCPVVSTDCPGGPNEILEAGRYGTLVPVDDTDVLCDTIARTLAKPTPKPVLQARAAEFSFDKAIHAYETLIENASATAR